MNRAGWRGNGLIPSALGQGVVAIASLASIRIYSELMTREQFGICMMATGLLAMLDGLVVMAFNQTLLSMCPGLSEAERQRQIAVGLAARLSAAVLGVGSVATSMSFVLWRLGLAPSAWLLVSLLVLVYLCEEILKTSMTAVLLSRQLQSRYAVWSATESMASLLFTTLGLLLLGRSVVGFLAGFVAGRIATACVFFLLYFRLRYFIAIDWTLSRHYAATALRYGAPVSMMAPLGWLSTYLDRYMIAAAAGIANVGAYAAVAGLVARPYGIVTSALTNYFRPRMGTTVWSEAENAEACWLLAAAAIGALGVLAFLLLGHMIASALLAETYRSGAVGLMAILAASQTFSILTHAADNFILSSGSSGRLLRTQAALAPASLALVAVGTFAFGLTGAASGRLAAEMVKFATTYRLSCNVRAERLLSAPEFAPS